MIYSVQYEYAQDTMDSQREASELDQVIDGVVDDLSLVAAEGRSLPRRVTIARERDETILVSGELNPRKGCCSGWEVVWIDAATESELYRRRL